MALEYDKDGLLLPPRPCKDPTQKGWADYLDQLAEDVREGKIRIKGLHHSRLIHLIHISYDGETTK